jgi:hypothetical protein
MTGDYEDDDMPRLHAKPTCRAEAEAAWLELSGRNTARAWLGQWLPMYPPFPASWQMAIRPYITFPQAPLRSRTVGSPESGSDLGFSSDGLPKAAEAQMLVHIHPAPFRFARQTRSDNRLRIHRCARPCVRIAPAADPPSAQSPFARDKALPSPVRVSRTPSAGITLPSSLLRAHAPVLPPPRASV